MAGYADRITSEHADKPKFMALVDAMTGAAVDLQGAALGLPIDFDLDTAVGAQLDTLGLWIGLSRQVTTPITGVYFSFDTAGLGFDEGVWKGPFDPSTGITSMDDGTYRIMLRAKIGANNWDGTLASSAAILASMFDDDTRVFIQDNNDMSITIGVSGVIPSALFLALLSQGYVPIKPSGVRINDYLVTSINGGPMFGFDVENDYIAGFDDGSWPVPA